MDNCLSLSKIVDYDNLIEILIRYGNRPNSYNWKRIYPSLSLNLVKAVIDSSDECSVCFKRFLSLGVPHALDCKLQLILRRI